MSRALGLLLAAALIAGGLAACGKKNAPSPPEGMESQYTYPQTYPNPGAVLPQESEEEVRTGEAPAHASDITTFPTGRTKTTYGSGVPQ